MSNPIKIDSNPAPCNVVMLRESLYLWKRVRAESILAVRYRLEPHFSFQLRTSRPGFTTKLSLVIFASSSTCIWIRHSYIKLRRRKYLYLFFHSLLPLPSAFLFALPRAVSWCGYILGLFGWKTKLYQLRFCEQLSSRKEKNKKICRNF